MLMVAALVLFALGALHSVLGEWRILRHLPRVQNLPSLGFPPIVAGPQPPSPTLRACWHLLTIFGWTFAFIAARFAALPFLTSGERFVVRAMSVSLGLSAVLMLLGTRAKHVGWVGFLAAAAFCWLGAS